MDDSRILNAYDRGSADSYYGRKRNPHIKLEEGKKTFDLSESEKDSYNNGFDDNEEHYEKKLWD